jgi:hypothetical protein
MLKTTSQPLRPSAGFPGFLNAFPIVATMWSFLDGVAKGCDPYLRPLNPC